MITKIEMKMSYVGLGRWTAGDNSSWADCE